MASKNRAREARRGTRLDPARSAAAPVAAETAPAGRPDSSRERLTRRFFTGVEILLVVAPFAGLAVAGSLNLDAAGVSSLKDLMAQDPRFMVSFLAACVQPFAAYIVHIAYRHYRDGDGGYALGNLVGVLCAEMLMQSIPGVAGLALLLWRVWRPAAPEGVAWRRRRGVGGVLADVSGSVVVVLLAAVCAFASWRLNNG
ncbi:hypothetical protein [Caniella muris]|uniref:hypothetical protein n=1 Tax=Caniella muris TaxID=2941502 RepID=UPI00203B6CCE|nr:hypothetical protein [Caniella muris]